MWNPFKKTETRKANEPSWAALSTGGGGGYVSQRSAQTLTAVTAAVNLIAGELASLPPYVYHAERGGAGKREARDHALTRLIKGGMDSNGTTFHDFLESFVGDALLYGNGLAEIVMGTGGRLNERLTELRYIPWGQVSVVYLPTGVIVYDIMPVCGSTGATRRLTSANVLHLKDRTDDGLVGVSRLRRCSLSLETALQLQEYIHSLYTRGMFPSGCLEYAGIITDAVADDLRKRMAERYSGAGKAGSPLILQNGLTYKPIPLDLESMQILESRRFVTEEVARLYGIQPQLISDLSGSSYNTFAESLKAFRSTCLKPWCSKIEALFETRLLGNRYSFELDLQSLETSVLESRWNMYDIAAKDGILTIDEIREMEGYPQLAAQTPQAEDAVAGGA